MFMLEHIPINLSHLTEVHCCPGKAQGAMRCGASDKRCNAARTAMNPAFGGRRKLIGDVALLARCAASRCAARLAE